MTAAGTVLRADWMTAPETRAVVEALMAGGRAVRFVGGCVRDTLAGRPVKDIDLATPDPPETVIALLQAAGLKAVPTGISHGTVTAVSDGQSFEITTLRHDVETYGRRARVAFTDDWAADAARRDFTINAMSCAPDGALFDPFGGAGDLQAGRIRFVGDARQRIEEDYLRLLRFFRFHADYGRGEADADALAAAQGLAANLDILSGERVQSELLRLLETPDPTALLRIMLERGILAHLLPEVTTVEVLVALITVAPRDQAPDGLLRLAALLADGAPDTAAAVSERLRFSRAQGERLHGLLDAEVTVGIALAPEQLRQALYRLGPARVRDRLLLDGARLQAAREADARDCLDVALAEVARWRPVAFPLTGQDARALGIAEGPEIGRLLAAVEDWWLAADFGPGREACLAKLRVLSGRGADGP